MGRMHRRSAAVALLVGLPLLLLGALPALGLRLDAVQRHTPYAAVWHGTPDQILLNRVTITGRVQQTLSPGVFSPVAITVMNPNPRAIRMQRIKIKIAAIDAPHADDMHPCTKLDFQIQQMARRTLTVPAHRQADLGALGMPLVSWPSLGMRNRPYNQDGCRDAVLTLRFRSHKYGNR